MDYKKAAELEIGWWKAHHEKKYEGKDGVTDLMTQEYIEIYNMPEDVARNCVTHRILAGKEHDLAERENISNSQSEQHWAKALEHMQEHFKLLEDFLKTTS